MAELLERIGIRLGLTWTAQAAAPAPALAPVSAPAPAPALVFPPTEQVEALRAQIALGYVRGINRQLDAIAALGPDHAGFVDALRTLAARFDLDAMSAFLDRGAHHA